MEAYSIEMKNYLEQYEKQIGDYLREIDLEHITQVSELIKSLNSQGSRIHFTGVGKPSYVAGYGASLFSSIGFSSYVLDATEAIHGSLGQVKKGDIVIAISNSGETEELLRTIDGLNNNEAITVGISSNEESKLAQQSQIHLKVKVQQEGDTLNKPPRLSIIAEILIIQLISIELQNSVALTLDSYYMWHPGGNLGNIVKEELKHEN